MPKSLEQNKDNLKASKNIVKYKLWTSNLV